MVLCYRASDSLEGCIHLQDACDRRDDAEYKSEKEYNDRNPEGRPLHLVPPVEIPLFDRLWPRLVIHALNISEALVPVAIVVQVK